MKPHIDPTVLEDAAAAELQGRFSKCSREDLKILWLFAHHYRAKEIAQYVCAADGRGAIAADTSHVRYVLERWKKKTKCPSNPEVKRLILAEFYGATP